MIVACNRRGPQVHIEVRDNGIGMPAGELQKIFNAFHRSDASHTDGLGLGLFIVRRAAKFLGHQVEVRSAIGDGSCFTLAATAARGGQRSGVFRAPADLIAIKELAS